MTATVLIALASVLPAGARDAGADDPASRLRSVEEKLEFSRSRADTLEAEARELAEETARLSKRLVAIASRIQARETQITTTETRLASLGGDESKIRENLAKRRRTLAELLAGLQRLEQNPPPALAVKPEDALGAVRSAMLLGVIVPELRAEANALAQDLTRLKRLRRSIEREQNFLNQNVAALEIERKEVGELIETKQATTQLTTEEIDTERQRIASLARQARTFRELIARLDEEKQRAARKPQTKARKVAARAAALVKPSIRFSKARGKLAFPAQGVKIREFGTKDSFGAKAKGLSIATRKQAQITTPVDGWVVYAGPFRSYGQLLIINAGEGYHVLLAGMTRINADTGQFVRSGEPVGTMGVDKAGAGMAGVGASDEEAAGSAAIGEIAENEYRPVLYVEFRKGGIPIDPGPWWAGGDEKVSG